MNAGARMPGALGPPSERTAVIIRATLPPALERLRRRSVAVAGVGVPAHLTMLHPFAAPARLRADVRRRVASAAAAIQPFEYHLRRGEAWPDVLYAAVEPIEPFLALQGRLAEAFPEFPIYGTDPGFEFVPHVTVADLPPIDGPVTLEDPAWRSLPRPGRAAFIEVIARPTDAPWRTIWRLPLGRMRT